MAAGQVDLRSESHLGQHPEATVSINPYNSTDLFVDILQRNAARPNLPLLVEQVVNVDGVEVAVALDLDHLLCVLVKLCLLYTSPSPRDS